MDRFTKKIVGPILIVGFVGLSLLALAQTREKLLLNGSVASNRVRVIEGLAYVPIADVAGALKMQVVKRPDGYELTTAGGANQVEGMRGKIGDTLFNGKWRFKVLDVQEAPSYKMKTKATSDYGVYNSTAEFSDDTYSPKPGNRLVVVRCQIKNGLKQNQALWRSNTDTHTALTDDQGQSYPPIAYDIEEAAPFQSKALLPGSSAEFAVLFTVPQNARLKDLVFTLRTISDKGSDVRVDLTR